LSTREVEFTSINIQESPTALKELKELGVMALPVVVRGDEYAIGLDMQQVIDLIGVADAPPELLPAKELVARVVRIVPVAVRFGLQLPPATHDHTIPGRDRTYLGLANHIVAHVEMFLGCAGGAAFRMDDIDEEILKGLERRIDSPADLATRARQAISDLEGWLSEYSPADLERAVETFFGDQSVHVLLGICAYSVCQHTRQLMGVLDILGIDPDGPLGEADYRGLYLPAGLWD
jgi:hypothetical protein